jgi:hypothetical protein
LLFAPLLGACAATARMTGGFGDYASYRRTRLAPTLEERLGAADRYLRNYPHGDYRAEVRAWFGPAEKHYFKLAWNNLPRLRAYLDEMPQGPHADAVVDRIGELESRSEFANQREARELLHASSIEARLARAAENRREFLHEFATLSGALARTRSFGEPTSNLDSELLLRFRVRQPAGSCDESHCTKLFSYPFAVPEDKSIVDREATATLEIALDRGLVQSVTLTGPELLTRVAEAAHVSAVPNNPQARAEAIAHAVDVIDDAIEPALPQSRCAADAVSPVVLARQCDGVRFEVSYGLDGGTPDRVTIHAEKR